MSKIIAVDFDQTLVMDGYPGITHPVPGAFEWLKQFQEEGARLILWTVRCDGIDGPLLTNAVNFCKRQGIEFWGVNRNPEQAVWSNSPKVFADR